MLDSRKIIEIFQDKRVQGLLTTNLNITLTLTVEKLLKKLDIFFFLFNVFNKPIAGGCFTHQ